MDFICKWEQVFKVADNANVLLMLTVWQHLCSPCVLAGQGPLPAFLLCAGQSLQSPTLRPPVGQPQPARMGCNKWRASALFWSCGHWWTHTLFASFVRSTTCLRAQATHIRYKYHLDPHWAAEVAPDPMCWDISRMCVAGHTFIGLP